MPNILQWDAEICMPRRGVQHRGDQMGALAGILHDWATDPRLGDLLSAAAGLAESSDPDSVEAVNLRELQRDYDRETKLPRALVEEMARVSASSSQAWSDARDNDDFRSFAPWLEKTFALAGEKADALGYVETRYDALLEDYEPGMTTTQLTSLFEQLRTELVPLVSRLSDSAPPESVHEFPIDRQRRFSESIAGDVGFDLEAGVSTWTASILLDDRPRRRAHRIEIPHEQHHEGFLA